MCLVTCEGHTAVVEPLIAAGAAIDTTHVCPVTNEGHTAVVEQLIAAGAAIDTTSKVSTCVSSDV